MANDLLQDLSWYFGNQGFDGECCEDLSLVEYMALKKAIFNIFNRYSEYMHETLGEVDEANLQNIKNTLELLNKVIQEKGFIKSN